MQFVLGPSFFDQTLGLVGKIRVATKSSKLVEIATHPFDNNNNQIKSNGLVFAQSFGRKGFCRHLNTLFANTIEATFLDT